jgi:large subunit ribosomal protein L21
MEKAMFAVVRTGGKQYRVAAGDKIVVEKLAGEAGDTIKLDDVLLAGEGADLRSTDGLTVSAEIIAQAKADKVIIFKKRRRHNYRRKKGHRQQHTILRIVAIGDQKAEKPKKAKAEKPASETAEAAPTAADSQITDSTVNEQVTDSVTETPAAEAPKKAKAKPQAPLKVEGAESEQVDAPAPAKKKASPKKPAAGKDA